MQARLEEAAQCLLVIIGATPEGAKRNLSDSIDGVRESAHRGKSSSSTSNGGGLRWDSELAIADGALGFLAGDRGGAAEDTRPALLGAQDRQCL